MAAGLSVVSVLAAAVATTYSAGELWDLLYKADVVLLAVTVLHAALIGDPSGERGRIRTFLAGPLPAVELGVAGGLCLASVLAVMLRDDLPREHRGILPGVGDLGLWVSTASLLAILVLAGCAVALALRAPERDVPSSFARYLKGMISPVVAALGLFLGVGFTAALDYGVLRVLRPADPAQSMALPLFHVRIAYAAGVVVMLVVAALAVTAVLYGLTAKRFRGMVRAAANLEPAAKPGDWLSAARVRSVARAWWLARVKFHVQWPAFALAVAGVLLTAAAVAEAVEDLVHSRWHAAGVTQCRPSQLWQGWWSWLDRLSGCEDVSGLDWVTLGTLCLLGLGAGLLYLGRTALGNGTIRRSVSVVWDLVAFWPRAIHPLVPPPYSPKVIEDLRRRIAWHLDHCAERYVVLAGHSQGSLISVAALTRLSPEHRARVALLTFGSQLQIAYARAFPAYVNYAYLRWIWGTGLGGRWRSLYRETDPIGGPVLSWDRTKDGTTPAQSHRLTQASLVPELIRQPDVVDEGTFVRRCGSEWRLLDPAFTDEQTTPYSGLRRHSSYSLDPTWQLAIDDMLLRNISEQQPAIYRVPA